MTVWLCDGKSTDRLDGIEGKDREMKRKREGICPVKGGGGVGRGCEEVREKERNFFKLFMTSIIWHFLQYFLSCGKNQSATHFCCIHHNYLSLFFPFLFSLFMARLAKCLR